MANYLIVGGTKGIGRSLTEMLSEENHTVQVVARNKPDNLAGSASFDRMDVLDTTYEYDGDSLDGLVYCPGSINLKPFASLKPEDFQSDLEINLLSAIKHIQANLKKLKKSDNGSIVLFSTVAVGQGMPFHTSVAAAKGAIEGFAKALAAELAPKVRVNVIAPSITDTDLAANLLSSDDKREKSGQRHPMKRVGTPKDIASMAEFLLSDKARWITGQVMHVDGGMSTIKQL